MNAKEKAEAKAEKYNTTKWHHTLAARLTWVPSMPERHHSWQHLPLANETLEYKNKQRNNANTTTTKKH